MPQPSAAMSSSLMQESAAEAGVVQPPEQQDGNAHAAPDQVVEVDALPDLHSENLGPRDAENAVGPAGQPAGSLVSVIRTISTMPMVTTSR